MPNSTPCPTPPLSLYLHLPWCIRKCPYCDFNSHAVDGQQDFARYVDALISDLAFERPLVGERPIETIFIGGGTPSLFPPKELGRLLEAVCRSLNCAGDLEITLEANPGAVEAGRFNGFRSIGINRLSIGVQSFDDRRLLALGRVHSSGDAERAIRTARDAGFDNINLDLMFGLPGQDRMGAAEDLCRAIDWSPEHISYYQLTLEPNTLFAAQPPPLPADTRLEEMHDDALMALDAGGYHQYEVSAHARTGFQCRHNRNYWGFGDYLGIGAGAHGKISAMKKGEIVRRARIRGPGDYMVNAGNARVLSENRLLQADDLCLEFAMNAFRMKEGFGRELFEQRTGRPYSDLLPYITEAEQRGLVVESNGRLRTSELGWRFLNDLLALFL